MLALNFSVIDGVRRESGARIQLAPIRQVEDDDFDDEDFDPDNGLKSKENRRRAYIYNQLRKMENTMTEYTNLSRAKVRQIIDREDPIPVEQECRWTYIPVDER